jgi:DnaJ-class molecular chaperone
MPPVGDLYAVLGLDRRATEAEVKKAYRTLAMTCHPDKNPDDPSAKERFHAISDAYSTLSDQEKRACYDGDDVGDFIMRVRASRVARASAAASFLSTRPCSQTFFKWADLGTRSCARASSPSPLAYLSLTLPLASAVLT